MSFSVVKILTYDFSTNPHKCMVNDYLKELKFFAEKNASDIILGFTTKELFYVCDMENGAPVLKYCAGFGDRAGAAIIRLTPWDRINTFITCHELAHVFDAIHCDDTASIMIKSISVEEKSNAFINWIRISPPIPQTFDRRNKQIILFRKFKKFTKAFPSSYHIEHRIA